MGVADGGFGGVGAHAEGAGGLEAAHGGREITSFDQFAIHPGKDANEGDGLFAFAEQVVEKLQGVIATASGDHVGQFPDCIFASVGDEFLDGGGGDFSAA